MIRVGKALLLTLLASLFFLASGVWFSTIYLSDFVRYQRLASRGVETPAAIVTRGIVTGDYLEIREDTRSSDSHAFDVMPASGRPRAVCRVRVSRSLYRAREIDDEISVTHLPGEFDRCVLTRALPVNRALSIFVLAASGLAVLLGIGLLAFVYLGFRKPSAERPTRLTSRFDPGVRALCPSCGSDMAEGYVPATGGLAWREPDEPVGLPTIFSGLPGTVFWLRRPRLQAFRCEECQVLTLKYGGVD